MADLLQIEKALRNADAAGDVEGAKILAAEYARVRAAQSSGNPSLMEVLSNVGTGIGRGLSSIAAGTAALENLGEPMRAGMRGRPMRFQDPGAVQQQAEDTVFSAIPRYTPTTAAGRIGQAAVAGGTAGLLGGGLLPGAIAGGIGGAAQQGAAEAGLPEGAQMLAGVAAPLAAGTIVGGARVAFPGATRAIQDIVQRLTPQQLTDAGAMMQMAAKEGSRLTWPEAIAQVTGGGMRQLLSIQRVLEQSREGSKILDAFMSQRVAGNQEVMSRQLAQIGPEPTGQALKDVPFDVQTGAATALTKAKQQRTNAVNPDFNAAASDVVPMPSMQGLLSKVDAEIAKKPEPSILARLQKLRAALIDVPAKAGTPGTPASRAVSGGTPQRPIYSHTPATPGTPAQPEVPKTRIDQLNSVRKTWQELIDLPAVAAEGNAQKTFSGIVQPLLKELDTAMLDASQKYASGNQKFQQISEQTVNPLKRGLVGEMSKAGTMERQAALLNADTVDPQQIQAFAQRINRYGKPGAVRNWVRTYIDSVFSEQTKDNMGGPNQWGGAKFRSVVAGNTKDAARFEALVRALPNGDTVWQGMVKALNIYQAQGRRQAPNSMTEFNRQISEQLGGGKFNVQFVSRMQNAIDQWRYGGRSGKLAELITDPNNIERWRALARGRTGGAGFALGIVATPPAVSQIPGIGSGNLFGVQ